MSSEVTFRFRRSSLGATERHWTVADSSSLSGHDGGQVPADCSRARLPRLCSIWNLN